MPFCTQCGSQVGGADVFCGACGAQQAATRSARPPGDTGPAPGAGGKQSDFLRNLTPLNASTLCYIPVVGWIPAIVFLAADRFRHDRNLRFHAFQGLYLFVLWLFVDWVFGPMTAGVEAIRFVGKGMKVGLLGAWIFMLVKTSQGSDFRLPILGELADRSVSEQR